jgi:hypothetical protein
VLPEQPGAVRRADPGGVGEILDGNGNAVQRTARGAVCELFGERLRGVARLVAGYPDEGVETRFSASMRRRKCSTSSVGET